MAIPREIQQVVEQALQRMRADPQRALERRDRLEVLGALGPVLDPAQPGGTVGQRRRALLEMLTVAHYLPLWRAAFPDNTDPDELLADAERALTTGVRRSWANTRASDMWMQIDALAMSNLGQRNGYALSLGYGAVCAFNRAFSDMGFNPDEIASTVSDRNAQPIMMDASFLVADTVCRGFPWEPDSSSDQRQTFWEWWLTTAVPAAYDAVGEDGAINESWRAAI